MDLAQAVRQLDAAADQSRLRLLVALLGGETRVGDLVHMLEQSQPRVSRHLRLLMEAGLVDSFREGRSIFYRWSDGAIDSGVAGFVAAVAAGSDATITHDRERLQKLVRQRERDAVRRALRSGHARTLHGTGTDELPTELRTALAGTRESSAGTVEQPLDFLHVGCGSGELLGVLLPEARVVVGTEASGHRRELARARLRQSGLPRWTIRESGPAPLPFFNSAFDVVILEDALGPAPADQPLPALLEAVRVLRPDGRLVILDRVLPTEDRVANRLAEVGLCITRRQWLPGRAPDRALFVARRQAASTGRTGTHD